MSRISFRTLLFPRYFPIIFAILFKGRRSNVPPWIHFPTFELREIIIRVREINTINTMFRFDFIHAVCRTWTILYCYSQADVVSKRWQLHAVYIIISLETPSFRLIRVHARPYKLVQATKSAPLIDSRLARDRSDHVSIFQIHISLPRGNYLATAGRSSSFENSNFQSFIDISFAKSSIFSRKMVKSVVYAG